MERNHSNPFDILLGRAMISLGPVSPQKHCPYSCLFCYVPTGFLQYRPLGIIDICKYLKTRKNEFETIYISGDTDSFAPPRMEQGISLLKRLANEFDKSILITTRAFMNKETIDELLTVKNILRNRNKQLYVCVSISAPDGNRAIEPLPIPTVEDRIKTLDTLKKAGILSILAMRPFLPIYEANDYIRLIDSCLSSVDLILGEVWYHDPYLQMWNAVTGKFEIYRGTSAQTCLPFESSNKEWMEWVDTRLVEEISGYCKLRNIPFFMDSSSALKYLREQTSI